MPDLQRENDNLQRLLEIARYMALTNDLDVLLGTIVEAACEVLDCERATIFLYDPRRDELYSRVAKGVEGIRFPAGRGVAGAAAQSRQCINVPDAYTDPRFNPDVDRRTGYRTRNLLAVPMEHLNGDLIGVLQALNKPSGPFTQDDEGLARVLAAQAGVALDRGRLMEEYVEKQRMQRDLDIARSIQQDLFPKKSPCLAGYEIAGWNRPADETGGDFYDFIALPDGRLAVLLADATGHGIGAALVTAQCRSLFRAMISVTQDLSAMAARVNDLLAQDLAESRFVTAFVGLLDPQRHVIEYISGGQGPLLLVTSAGVESRDANALPFAALPELDSTAVERFEFTPGALLALLTDGFFEAAGASEELYGERRVRAFLEQHRERPPADLIAALNADVERFTDGRKQADDLTAVLIRRTS